jgi:hypothetical protein
MPVVQKETKQNRGLRASWVYGIDLEIEVQSRRVLSMSNIKYTFCCCDYETDTKFYCVAYLYIVVVDSRKLERKLLLYYANNKQVK